MSDTSKISLFVPKGTSRMDIIKQLNNEWKEVDKIKDKINRARVTLALANLMVGVANNIFPSKGYAFWADESNFSRAIYDGKKSLYWVDNQFIPINFFKKTKSSRSGDTI